MFKTLTILFILLLRIKANKFDPSTCGVSKGCFIPKNPECYQGCNQMGFSYVFFDETHMSIEIFGKAEKQSGFYYAVGFSYDDMMGDDYVIECSSLGNKDLSLKFSYNSKVGNEEPTNVRIKDSEKYTNYFQGAVTSITDGMAYCSALVKVTGSPNEPQLFKYNSSVMYYLLMATGPASEDGLRHHLHDTTSPPTNLQDIAPNFDANGCGLSKRCFLPITNECEAEPDNMKVSYNMIQDDLLEVEIVGKVPAQKGYYVAAVFTDDLTTGDGSVLECSAIGTDNLSMKFSVNHANNNLRIPDEEKYRGSYIQSHDIYQDGNVYCKGIVNISNPVLFQYNPLTQYYLLLLTGTTSNDGLNAYSNRCSSKRSTLLKNDDTIEIRDNCGDTKGCFVPQTCYRGCNGMSFTYKLSDDNQTMFIELSRVASTSSLYVAVGFSDDDEMGNESVVECSDTGTGYSIKYSYNKADANSKYNMRIPSEQDYRLQLISQEKIIFTDGTLYCSASINVQGIPQVPMIFTYNATLPYYFLLASGPTSAGNLQHHEHTVVADYPILLSESMAIVPVTFDCSECGLSKGCFFPQGQAKCDGFGFTYSWTKDHLMLVEFVISPAAKYVGVGFSDDNLMGNESVIECSQLTGQDYSIKFSYNNGKPANERIAGEPDARKSYITGTSYSVKDGYAYCKGVVNVTSGSSIPKIFQYDNKKSYYLLLASGSTDNTTLKPHGRNAFVAPNSKNLETFGSSTPAPVTNSHIDCSQCYKSFGCFFPDGSSTCTGAGATYRLLNESMLELQLIVPQSYKYIALGFSSDNRMGNDYVIECSALTGKDYTMKFSWNNANPLRNERIPGESKIESTYFTNYNKKVEDGMLYCSATVDIHGWSESSKVFSYKKGSKYYLLLAMGATTETDLARHVKTGVSGEAVDLGSIAQIKQGMSADVKHRLIVAHAILMILSWCCFVPTALIFARLLRNSWPLMRPGGLLIWFHVHRTANLTGILCMIASFACILTANNWKWTGPGAPGSYWGQTHTMTGLIALVLAWLQPFISTMRCSPNTPNRFIFNWIHRGIGVTSYVLATTALCIAAYHFDFIWNNTVAQLTLSLVPIGIVILLCVLGPMIDYFGDENSIERIRQIVVFVLLIAIFADAIALCILVGVGNP